MNDTDRAQKVLDATKGYKLRYAYKRDRQKIIAVALREAIQCVLPDEIGGVHTAWKQEMLHIADELEQL
jgi:hypothetical protein